MSIGNKKSSRKLAASPNKGKSSLAQKQASGKNAVKKAKTRRSSKKPGSAAKVKQKNKGLTRDIAFPIVGIGASAGGLEAIEGFFSHMPSNVNIAFVIIQHLAPKYKSIMGSLLKKYTNMKVLELTDKVRIEPNCIYLNPPNKDVAIINRTLQLIEPLQAHGTRLPIDHFFRSLAEDQGEKAICIILSGTGTDGTLGLKAIKGEGGMTMVQEERQARYDGMPRSAIETGLVDYVLPVERMPEELMKYVKHPYIEGPKKASTAEEQFNDYIQKIFLLIRSSTGHDFSNYKQNTIRRRIERRMAVHQINRIADYHRYIRENPAEVETLYKDMLIGVTNFFRDPDSFKILKEKVITKIFRHKRQDTPIRVWVPGCSTGEEAYSLTILIVEMMESIKRHFNIQVFATDLDAEAIEYARNAVYPDSIAADVSQERLKRFFVKNDSTYKVKKQIREKVVFAVQNLIKDPAFSRLNLISCRNVLIYMDAVLQKKIIPLFHYTLCQDGFLFLGSSESIGEYSNLFLPIDAKWKIFQRKGAVSGGTYEFPRMPFVSPIPEPQRAGGKRGLTEADIRDVAEKVILESYAPPCVLVNESYDILYFYGRTDRYLFPPTGEPTFNILKMARKDLRYKLTTTLHKAVKQKKEIVTEALNIRDNNEFRTINLVVRPVTEIISDQGLMMVVFEDCAPPVKLAKKGKKVPEGKTVTPHILSLEQELQSAKEYLQTTIEELETSNEELKSTNEELQSTNEEMQSTNEELETSKEELQSTNEELETVNSELQNKVDELSHANNDLNNLLGSTQIGTIFLDNNLCIKRFTPSAARILNLIQSDMGRPISDITTKVTYEALYDDAKGVLDTLKQKEAEIRTRDNNWYSMRILPYRTVDNVIDGVVMTFVDITKVKEAREELHASEEKYRAIFDEARDGIALIDAETGHIVECNAAFEAQTGRKRESLNKMKIWEVRPHGKMEAAEKKFLDIKKKGKGNSRELEIEKPGGEIVPIEFMSKAVKIGGKHYIQSIVRDISKNKQAEDKITQIAEEWESTFNSITDFVSIHDKDFKILRVNKAFADLFNRKPEELIGKSCYEVVHGTKEPHRDCPFKQAMTSKRTTVSEYLEPALGMYLEVTALPLLNKANEVIGCVHIMKDITGLKKAEEKHKQPSKSRQAVRRKAARRGK